MIRAVCLISNSIAIAKVSSVWHRVAKGGLDTRPLQWQTAFVGWYSGLQSMCETVSLVVSSPFGGRGMW